MVSDPQQSMLAERLPNMWLVCCLTSLNQGTAFSELWGYDVTVVASMHPKFSSDTPEPRTWLALLIQQCAGLILGQEYCPSAPTPPIPDLTLVYRLLEAVIRHLPPQLRRKVDVQSGWRSSLQGWEVGPRDSIEQLLFAIIDWLREGNGKGFPPLARQETAPRLTVVSAAGPGLYNCLDGELPAGKFLNEVQNPELRLSSFLSARSNPDTRRDLQVSVPSCCRSVHFHRRGKFHRDRHSCGSETRTRVTVHVIALNLPYLIAPTPQTFFNVFGNRVPSSQKARSLLTAQELAELPFDPNVDCDVFLPDKSPEVLRYLIAVEGLLLKEHQVRFTAARGSAPGPSHNAHPLRDRSGRMILTQEMLEFVRFGTHFTGS